jgi:hypothetical protein
MVCRPQDEQHIHVAADWLDVAERLCSAAWHDPAAAHDAAVDAKLYRECFPDERVWLVFRILTVAAELSVRPTERAVRLAADELGYLPDRGDGFDLIRRLPFIESTAAGAQNYAVLLAQYARHRALAEVLRVAYLQVLDRFEDADEIAAKATDAIQRWQADSDDAPRPPRLRRSRSIQVLSGGALNSGSKKRRRTPSARQKSRRVHSYG